MTIQRLTAIVTVLVVSGLAPLHAWETLECIHMGSDWTMEVPTSCADVCTPDTTDPSNREWLRTSFIPNSERNHPSGLPIVIVDQCWVHNWACANGFVARFACMSTSLSHPEKSIGISIGKNYFNEDGSLEPMPPVKPPESRTWETGSTEFTASELNVAGGEGRAEWTITRDFKTSATDCESETREAQAWVRFRNQRFSCGYREDFMMSGSCRDQRKPDDPYLEPFRASPQAAVAALTSFVEHLASRTEEAVAWGRGGPAPDAGPAVERTAEAEPEAVDDSVTAVVSADGFRTAVETWLEGEDPPSQIMIVGFVRDAFGSPVVGAHLSLPGFDANVLSDQFGLFRLSASGDGEKPLLVEWNPVLLREETAAAEASPTVPMPVVPEPTAPAPPVPTASPAPIVTPTPVPAAAPSFLAIRQKTSGDCLVVVGVEGLGPGDIVFGSFDSFAEAHRAATAQCRETQTEPVLPAAEPVPNGKPVPTAVPTPHPVAAGPALTSSGLSEPVETVTLGTWGAARRLSTIENFNRNGEPGLALDEGWYVVPGDGGPTELVYSHNGDAIRLRGLATVIDCLHYCGGAGSMVFEIVGDGRRLWRSPLIRQNEPAQRFDVGLEGIRELRLIATNGGNGSGEDWGAWLELTIGSESAAAPANAPGAPPITRAGRTAGGTFGAMVIAVPRYDTDQATEGIVFVNLDTGNAFFIDKVRSSPLELRSRSSNRNIFTALDRPLGRPAAFGEVLIGEIRARSGEVGSLLLADTASGRLAYLVDPSHDGGLLPVEGRPGAPLAADDGNFALVMRRSDSGRTEGAYLYHGSTGRCLYIDDVGRRSTRPDTGETTRLPALEGRITALGIEAGSEATHALLAIDDASGDIHVIDGVRKKPRRLEARTADANLFSVFPRTAAIDSPQRFVAVPLAASSGTTASVLIVDVGSGALAVMRDVHDARRLSIQKSHRNVYEVLPRDVVGRRTMSAVPRVTSSGAAVGVWIFDSVSGRAAYLSSPSYPGRHEVHAVSQKTR